MNMQSTIEASPRVKVTPAPDRVDIEDAALNIASLAALSADLLHQLRLRVEGAMPAMRFVSDFEHIEVLIRMIGKESAVLSKE